MCFWPLKRKEKKYELNSSWMLKIQAEAKAIPEEDIKKADLLKNEGEAEPFILS